LHSLPRPAAPLSSAPLLGTRSPFGAVARATFECTASIATTLSADKQHCGETVELARGEVFEP